MISRRRGPSTEEAPVTADRKIAERILASPHSSEDERAWARRKLAAKKPGPRSIALDVEKLQLQIDRGATIKELVGPGRSRSTLYRRGLRRRRS
jgi:hypothetical protein